MALHFSCSALSAFKTIKTLISARYMRTVVVRSHYYCKILIFIIHSLCLISTLHCNIFNRRDGKHKSFLHPFLHVSVKSLNFVSSYRDNMGLVLSFVSFLVLGRPCLSLQDQEECPFKEMVARDHDKSGGFLYRGQNMLNDNEKYPYYKTLPGLNNSRFYVINI